MGFLDNNINPFEESFNPFKSSVKAIKEEDDDFLNMTRNQKQDYRDEYEEELKQAYPSVPSADCATLESYASRILNDYGWRLQGKDSNKNQWKLEHRTGRLTEYQNAIQEKIEEKGCKGSSSYLRTQQEEELAELQKMADASMEMGKSTDIPQDEESNVTNYLIFGGVVIVVGIMGYLILKK
jgi:hypothetical protein